MAAAKPVSDSEAARLFAGLTGARAIILAVSGGPDSTALLALAARWRMRHRNGPELIAVTVDHGLRPEARREAAAVKRLARSLGVTHRTVKWNGRKPATGLQEKARAARYGLLAEQARRVGALHVVTAHTRDDQAETVLFRMARGSGLAGLGAMAELASLPVGDANIFLYRPLLGVPKARLLATLAAHGITYAEDASNQDPRFTRVRWRALMPGLSREGLDSARLAALAQRLRRANVAIERVVDAAAQHLQAEQPGGSITVAADRFFELPGEIALRLVGRAVARIGNEGAVELAKLERLMDALAIAGADQKRFRSTLAGAMITLSRQGITVERAPARRNPRKKPRKRT
ncbi:MAG: tRNA lysidine(34) synthetase TilS [Xanthobacteraceae bacterium]